jgi:hypothetical protein
VPCCIRRILTSIVRVARINLLSSFFVSIEMQSLSGQPVIKFIAIQTQAEQSEIKVRYTWLHRPWPWSESLDDVSCDDVSE